MQAIRAGGARAKRKWPRERALFRHGITGPRDGGSGNGRDGPAALPAQIAAAPGIRDGTGCAFCPLNWRLPKRKKPAVCCSGRVVLVLDLPERAFAFIPMLAFGPALRRVNCSLAQSHRSWRYLFAVVMLPLMFFCAGALCLTSATSFSSRPISASMAHQLAFRNARYMKDVFAGARHRVIAE